ncbi:MAG: hypothetical protein NVSMB62_07360 [Acidobacteriaceae bacterium]
MAAGSANALRPDVAAIDRERILRSADRYLAERPEGITALRSERSPTGAQDYFSEKTSEADNDQAASSTFTLHRDALFALSLRVAGLAAAQLLTGEKRYGDAAAGHLRVWFLDPMTRMVPRLEFAQVPSRSSASKGPAARVGSYTGLIETLPLVEVVQAIPFLAAAGSLTHGDLTLLQEWFGGYLRWLTAPEDSGPRLPALARDQKDHHATSWMLQVASYTLFTVPNTGAPKNEDRAMTELRHRFRSVTLRNQIAAEGMFRHEISSANSFRDSLFNLDMLAALCLLLSTRFENVWEYQLEDGPGMQVAMAYHFPSMANRAKWPYRADAQFFSQLPGRRTSLLFAARAYQRPEYAALWKTLDPDPAALELQRTLPARQPLLWVRQPPRAVTTAE